jgi:hypothetical protein
MARIRTIKPDYWTDGKVVSWSPFARLLFIGMWNFTMCDHGHVADDPVKLKLQILPMDDVNIDALLAEIMDSGRVKRVTDPEGRTYLHITRFSDHQKIDPRWKTRCPACATPELTETHPSLGEPRRDSPELPETPPRKGREGKGNNRAQPPADAAPTTTIEHDVTTWAYEQVDKGFNFIAARSIVKWAIHDKGADAKAVAQALVDIYKLGKPITKQTVGQRLDGLLTGGPGGKGRPLGKAIRRTDNGITLDQW